MVARHATEAAAQRAAERDWERAREVEQATAVEAARTEAAHARAALAEEDVQWTPGARH